MHYHSQNLNEGGCALLHGRSWLHLGEPYQSRQLRLEWCFLNKARGFTLAVWTHSGDSDRDITFIVCLPWLFAFYFTIENVFRKCAKESQTGIKIHDSAIWLHPYSYTMESNRDDVWYRKTYSWSFPWSLDWHSTEILTHDRQKTVWMEIEKKRKPFFETWDERKAAEASVTKVYPYEYTLKNGEVQQRTAAVFVERRKWRAKWWPIIPISKTVESIDIRFSEEVGEGIGSWKGGVTGCGYDLLPNETPLECLGRMQRERKFRR